MGICAVALLSAASEGLRLHADESHRGCEEASCSYWRVLGGI